MRVLLAMFVAVAMTFGVSSALAGSSCSMSKKQSCCAKASKDCGNCGYKKGSKECADACAKAKAEGAAETCASCGYKKGSAECAAACAKDNPTES